MDATRRQQKANVKASASSTAVKSAPAMQEVQPELKEEKAADVIKQDNKAKPKAAVSQEVLDASSAKAGVFPVIEPKVFEALYSKAKAFDEVSKPIVTKELEDAIDAMRTKLQFDLPHEINVLCCKTVIASIVHGNIWPARKLMQAFGAMPKGQSKTMFRVVALRDWLVAKGPFVWKEVGDMIDYSVGKPVENAKGLTIDGNRKRELEAAYKKDTAKFVRELVDVPFWAFKPLSEDSFAKFDFKKELNKLLKRAAAMETRLGEHKQGDEIHLEGLSVVRSILPKLNAGQITHDPAEKKAD